VEGGGRFAHAFKKKKKEGKKKRTEMYQKLLNLYNNHLVLEIDCMLSSRK